MKALIFIALIWAIIRIVSAIYHKAQAEKAEREQQRIREEQAAIREQMRMDRERAKAETRRQIEAEKARIAWQKRQEQINRQAAADRERLRKEQERQAKELAKHDEQMAKMQFQLDTATEDIYNILEKLEEQQKYAEYLLDQRDKCAENSAEYFKWQSKLSVVDDKIYRLNKQRAKAMFLQEQAQRKLA